MAGPSYEKTMLILAILATSCSVASMLLTGSIALKCNGKLTRKLEQMLRMKISEQ